IIGTIWSASNGVKAIMKAFNRAYEVEEDRSFVVGRLIAILLTIAMVIVIFMAFLLPIFGKMIGIYIFSFFGLSDKFIAVWGALRWIISSVVFSLCLSHCINLHRIRVFISNMSFGDRCLQQFAGSSFPWHFPIMWFYISGIIIISGGVLNACIIQYKLDAKKE